MRRSFTPTPSILAMCNRRFPAHDDSTTSGSATAGTGPSGPAQSSGGSESEEESESDGKSEGDSGTLQGDRPPFVPSSPASVADAMGGLSFHPAELLHGPAFDLENRRTPSVAPPRRTGSPLVDPFDNANIVEPPRGFEAPSITRHARPIPPLFDPSIVASPIFTAEPTPVLSPPLSPFGHFSLGDTLASVAPPAGPSTPVPGPFNRPASAASSRRSAATLEGLPLLNAFLASRPPSFDTDLLRALEGLRGSRVAQLQALYDEVHLIESQIG